MSTTLRRLVIGLACLAGLTACASTTGAGHTATTRTPAPAATLRATLAPVDRQGRPVPGWTVRASDETVFCTPPLASPSALSPDVHQCFPTAMSADTCWPAADGSHVLCLVDPWQRELVSYGIEARLGSLAAAAHPVPLGLDLAGGEHCRLRDGGAGEGALGHPDWVAHYLCPAGVSVWGPGETSGITTTSARWTVRLGTDSAPLRTSAVVRAYYVTTYVTTATRG